MKIGIGLPSQVHMVRACVIPDWASQPEKSGVSTLGTVGRVAYPSVMDTIALAASAGATRVSYRDSAENMRASAGEDSWVRV
jgi:hypothetical protein